MTSHFVAVDGVPHVVRPESINLGLAVDVEKEGGARTLLVPTIKAANEMDFAGFWAAYEEVIRKVRSNKLSPDDFALLNRDYTRVVWTSRGIGAVVYLIIGGSIIGYTAYIYILSRAPAAKAPKAAASDASAMKTTSSVIRVARRISPRLPLQDDPELLHTAVQRLPAESQ